jgi:AraC family transcriptional activator of pobA
MRGLLALIAIGVARLAGKPRAHRQRHARAGRRDGRGAAQAGGENFRKQRHLEFYAQALAMTPDRLNDHVKRATGVTAGPSHPPARADRGEAPARVHRAADPRDRLRPGVLDPSHFARFFRKQTGTTPHEFRAGRS